MSLNLVVLYLLIIMDQNKNLLHEEISNNHGFKTTHLFLNLFCRFPFLLFFLVILSSCSNYDNISYVQSYGRKDAKTNVYSELTLNEYNLSTPNETIDEFILNSEVNNKPIYCDTVYFENGNKEFIAINKYGKSYIDGVSCISGIKYKIAGKKLKKINFSSGKIVDYENPENNKPHQYCDSVQMLDGTNYKLILKNHGVHLVDIEKCHEDDSEIPRVLVLEDIKHVKYREIPNKTDDKEFILATLLMKKEMKEKVEFAYKLIGFCFIPFIGIFFSAKILRTYKEIQNYNEFTKRMKYTPFLNSSIIKKLNKAKKMAKISMFTGLGIFLGIILGFLIAMGSY